MTERTVHIFNTVTSSIGEWILPDYRYEVNPEYPFAGEITSGQSLSFEVASSAVDTPQFSQVVETYASAGTIKGVLHGPFPALRFRGTGKIMILV